MVEIRCNVSQCIRVGIADGCVGDPLEIVKMGHECSVVGADDSADKWRDIWPQRVIGHVLPGWMLVLLSVPRTFVVICAVASGPIFSLALAQPLHQVLLPHWQ